MRSQLTTPTLRLPHRVLVPNHHRGPNISKHPLMRTVWTSSHHKRNIPLRQVGLYIAQSLVQKRVMPQIRMRKIRNPRKVHHQRKPQQVRRLHRHINRMIINTTLSPLYPVNNALPATIRRATSPHSHACILTQPKQLLRNR